MSEWVLLAVDQEVCWLAKETTCSFCGRDLILRPPEKTLWPDISIERLADEDYSTAATIVRRFLSAAAWRWKVPFREMGQSGGTHRTRIGGRMDSPLRIFPGLDLSEISVPRTTEQRRAMALYREALGLEPNQTYKFLALFRIFNITLGTPTRQITWINDHVLDVDFPALNRVSSLKQKMPAGYASIGEYLYAADRSAIAHAFQPPLVDPDEVSDTYQINLDYPLVEKLVDLYMELELGLPST